MYALSESTTPALKARSPRRAALGSGPWVRSLSSFIDMDWAQ